MWWFHSTIILELFYAPLLATALGLYESFQNFVAVWLWTWVRSHTYFHCKNLPQHFVCVFFLQLFGFHVFLLIKIMPLKITSSLQSWNSVFQFRVFKLVVFQHIFFYAYKYYPALNISCIRQWVPFSGGKKKKKTVLQAGYHENRGDKLPLPAGNAAQDMTGFLGCKYILMAPVHFFLVPNPSLQSCCLSIHSLSSQYLCIDRSLLCIWNCPGPGATPCTWHCWTSWLLYGPTFRLSRSLWNMWIFLLQN